MHFLNIDQILTIFLNVPLGTILTCGFFIILVNSFSLFRQRKVQRGPVKRRQWFWEAQSVLVSVLVDASCYVLLSAILGINYVFDSNLKSNIITFILMLLWFDLWFYAWHRLFHHRYFYRFHRQHHRSIITTPLTAHSFSIIERVILNLGVMLPVIIINLWGPMPFYGHVAYLYTIMIINTYGHSNVELLPKVLTSRTPFKYICTPTSHSLHHIHQTGNYGLVLVFLDRLFKTEIKETPENSLNFNARL